MLDFVAKFATREIVANEWPKKPRCFSCSFEFPIKLDSMKQRADGASKAKLNGERVSSHESQTTQHYFWWHFFQPNVRIWWHDGRSPTIESPRNPNCEYSRWMENEGDSKRRKHLVTVNLSFDEMFFCPSSSTTYIICCPFDRHSASIFGRPFDHAAFKRNELRHSEKMQTQFLPHDVFVSVYSILCQMAHQANAAAACFWRMSHAPPYAGGICMHFYGYWNWIFQRVYHHFGAHDPAHDIYLSFATFLRLIDSISTNMENIFHLYNNRF